MTDMEKEQKYGQLVKEATSLLDGESDMIANMANLAALIHETMGFCSFSMSVICRKITTFMTIFSDYG